MNAACYSALNLSLWNQQQQQKNVVDYTLKRVSGVESSE